MDDKTRFGVHAGNLAAGAAARTVVGFAMMPITVIKVRYESTLFGYTGTLQALRTILRHEGVRGLFVGFGATALRDAPYAGIYVVFYEYFRGLMSTSLGEELHQLPPTATMICSASAGLAATSATQPFDVLKTRLQLSQSPSSTTDTPSSKAQSSPMRDSVSRILKESGSRGLFVGMIPRIARKTASAAITWTLYEEGLKAFASRNSYNIPQ